MDDDASMRELLSLHLRNDGYEVWAAEDAVAAGHLVLQSPPDLIIADVQMPYMNGYEFVRALKADPATRRIPVLFLTTDDAVASEAARHAARYLTKPVRADELLRVIGEMTGR